MAAAVAAVALLSGGCGTVCNLASGDPQVPFGGVQKDLETLQAPRSGSSRLSGSGKGAVVIVLLLPAELSLSFLGDTVTLPLAVWMRREDHDASADSATVNPTSAAPSASQP
jgi:hypothetical protein